MTSIVIRTAKADDLEKILEIQANCYAAEFLEDHQAFASKVKACPDTCWLVDVNGQPAAYLVSVPVDRHTFPALNAPSFQLSSQPELLYWHDMAVHPTFRSHGLAKQLAQFAIQQTKQMGFKQIALIAVQSSSTYWEKHGFEQIDAEQYGLKNKVLSFGQYAVFMQKLL